MDPNSIELITKDKITIDTTEWVYKSVYKLSSQVLHIDRNEGTNKAYAKAKDYYDTALGLVEKQMEVIKAVKPKKESPIKVKNALSYSDWNNNNTPPYKTSIIQSYKIESTDELMEWYDKAVKIYEYQLKEMETNVKTYEQSSVSSDAAASAFSKLLADDNFVEIQKLEKQIEYRKFYFPGNEAKLKKVIDGDMAPLGEYWDPRYIQEYISIAQQNGFAQWFIMPKVGAVSIQPCNVMTVWNYAKDGIDWRNGVIKDDSSNKNDLINMFVGMKYMDKFGAFIDVINIGSGDMPTINITESLLNRIYNRIPHQTRNTEMSKIVQYTGQTDQQFIRNDYGYYAQVDSMAFNCENLLAQLNAREREYKEFKNKLWEILKENPVLQLCTNNVNVTGNNINITQTMECVQSVSNAGTDDGESGNYDDNSSNSNNSNDDDNSSNSNNSSDDNNSSNSNNSSNDNNSSNSNNENNSSNNNENNSSNSNENNSSNSNNENTNSDDKPKEESKLKTWHIIVISISAVIVIVAIVFIIKFALSNRSSNYNIQYDEPQYINYEQQGGNKFVMLV